MLFMRLEEIFISCKKSLIELKRLVLIIVLLYCYWQISNVCSSDFCIILTALFVIIIPIIIKPIIILPIISTMHMVFMFHEFSWFFYM
jgi:hypothetical protein